MNRTFRPGALGALIDEYERASADLTRILNQITDAEFELLRDTRTLDEDCRSIQTIMSHVVHSGYGYANRLRDAFSLPAQAHTHQVLQRVPVCGPDQADAFVHRGCAGGPMGLFG